MTGFHPASKTLRAQLDEIEFDPNSRFTVHSAILWGPTICIMLHDGVYMTLAEWQEAQRTGTMPELEPPP